MIRSKNDAVKLVENILNTKKKGFPTTYPTFYFYNKDKKKHVCIINKSGVLFSISFKAMNERDTVNHSKLDNSALFIWQNRKYINKYIDNGIEHYNFN